MRNKTKSKNDRVKFSLPQHPPKGSTYLCFFAGEDPAAPHEVDEDARDGPIDVEDEIGLLLAGDSFHLQCEIEDTPWFEVFSRETLHNGDARV